VDDIAIAASREARAYKGKMLGTANAACFSQTLSTASVPARERLPIWREVFGRAMARLDIEAVADIPFHAEGALCALPGVAYATVCASPVRVTRTRHLIAADTAEMLYLITADAPVAVSQRGQDHMLATGDAIFVRGGDVSAIRWSSRCRLTNIAVALDDLRPFHAGADDLAMRVVPRQSELIGLLHGYIDILRTRMDAVSGAASTLAAGHIRDLICALATAEDEPREQPGVKAARLRAIKADIEMRLRDPRLNIDSIAARAGISPRYIRRLFQEEGSSLSAYILSERLDRAYRLLLHPGHGSRSIAAIAYGCGFGDLSYFNRTFRRAFNMTPSDVRGLHGQRGIRSA
jgi:AraC-like DNA-binding protein